MSRYIADDLTTAAVTASRKHVGELPLSAREARKRDLDREAHHARMEGNRWGATLNLLIGQRNDLRDAANPECLTSMFPARHDEACIAVVKRAASALGPSINEAMRMQTEAVGRVADFERQLIDLDMASRGGQPGPTNIEMAAMLHADSDQKREAIDKNGCCGGTPMADGVCFGIGVCPRHTEIQLCSRFCERLIAWTNELETQTLPENVE